MSAIIACSVNLSLLDVQTSYYCRCRLQPVRMYQHLAQAKYHFLFPIQQLRVLSSRPLRMTYCNGSYRAYNIYLQSHLSCPPGYFRQIQQITIFRYIYSTCAGLDMQEQILELKLGWKLGTRNDREATTPAALQSRLTKGTRR
jgi:hypothetical protein